MMKHIYIASCAADGGIYHYIFENESLTFKDKTSLDRPMYMVIRNNKMYVLLRELCKETRFGGLISFDINNEGSLINPSNIISTKGIVPCHLEVTENDIYVVNYLSGNIVKLPDTVVAHSGKGTHPTRQEAPHTHFVTLSPDNKYILCTDLGIDKIFFYDKHLNEQYTVNVPKGSGSRHLCFSQDGKYLYCVNELSNDVSVFEYNRGRPILKGTYATLPDFKEISTAAAIKAKDGFLYVSNRGADTISRFITCGDNLKLLENTYCGGKSPRDFCIINDHIICANETTNNVTFLKLENGKPVLSDISIGLESPLCVTGG